MFVEYNSVYFSFVEFCDVLLFNWVCFGVLFLLVFVLLIIVCGNVDLFIFIEFIYVVGCCLFELLDFFYLLVWLMVVMLLEGVLVEVVEVVCIVVGVSYLILILLLLIFVLILCIN